LLAVTDGAILAAKSDGALVVVKAGKTRRDQLAHAIGMLHDVGATLLGAVLTMMPTRGSGAYSYNYYYYGGSYGDDKTGQATLETATNSEAPVPEAKSITGAAEPAASTREGSD
jgi:receptor protein-tyrosine kinase